MQKSLELTREKHEENRKFLAKSKLKQPNDESLYSSTTNHRTTK